MSSENLENMLGCPKLLREYKPKPAEQAMTCPKCYSTNTKFCYYNNYSISQPNYFCKSCRRYWNQEGALRNVPVGGGTRKNKRSSSSSSKKISMMGDNNNNNPSFNSSISSGENNEFLGT
ncbi:hypothetical protein LIER_23853 [Lithospermum erythrorhizon]|uniref:Dof zinc finger protein n=1 Tax=Lithospermum erythrorhizon TaxID=34254 RepID=A0AAV3QZ07_LITER